MASRVVTCPICQNAANGRCTERPCDRDATILHCDACGEYELSRTAKVTLEHGGFDLSPVQRAAISHHLRTSSADKKLAVLTMDGIERLTKDGPHLPPPSLQAANALSFIGDHIGETGRNLESLPLHFYAAIGAATPNLAHQIARELVDEGLLSGIDTSSDDGPGLIDVGMKLRGWERYEAQRVDKASAEWVRAAEAVAMLKPILDGYSARLRICQRAHGGLILARADQFFDGRRMNPNHDVPKEFWWAEGNQALKQDWAAGDFSTWIERGSIQLRAFGVTFARADIAKILPPADKKGAVTAPVEKSTAPVPLSGIHAQIVLKCNGLYEAKHYAEAVEKSFKVVRDRLRVLTGHERASEAFGKGKLHIKGAAAPNVDADFNDGAKFLMMAIDMFRNEKSHTSDANISDPARAYQYLCVSSLAMTLLDEAEIHP